MLSTDLSRRREPEGSQETDVYRALQTQMVYQVRLLDCVLASPWRL